MGVINGLVGLVLGLAAGLITGYFFERRATSAAERENQRLRAELRALRESVYSVGGGRLASATAGHGSQELASQLHSWLHARQDADGKILFARAIAEFAERGFTRHDIEAATAQLCDGGQIQRERDWVLFL